MNNSRSKVLAGLDVEAEEQFISRAAGEDRFGLIRALRGIPTGRNAQRSLSDRWAAFQKAPVKDEEASFPVNARSQRRAQEAADRRSRRKGQRNYINRELAREAEANQLATLFNQIDGFTKVSTSQRLRAYAAIESRVKYLLTERLKSDADIEDVMAEQDRIWDQLRGLAKTAPVPLRGSARVKAQRAQKAAA